MKICPKGAIVNKKELEELIRALDVAIDEREVEMNSNLPPSAAAYDSRDRANSFKWKRDIRRWKKLRSLLAKGAA